MKRKIILLIVVLMQSIILLGSRQEEQSEPEGNVAKIIEKIDIDYKAVLNQYPEDSLGSDIEAPPEIVEEQVEIPKEEIEVILPVVTKPVTLPITTRQANDLYPDSGESIATINIPAINLYQIVTYGDSQENINAYEICLRTYSHFDQNGAVILAGHNYKSFSGLKYLNIGSEIKIHSYYGDFTFIVDQVTTGTTDGENIYSAEGNALIDMYDRANKLYLYTCDDSDPQKRLVVSAYVGGV